MIRHVLNPFSDEGKGIVKAAPPLNELPQEVFELARQKVLWRKSMKVPPVNLVEEYDVNNDVLSYYLLYQATAMNFSIFSGEVRLVKDITEKLTTARLKTILDKMGGGVVINIVKEIFDVKVMSRTDEGGMKFGNIIVKKRELYAHPQHRYGGEREIKYLVKWRSLIPLLRNREARFTDWDIRKGYVLLSLNDIITIYSKLVAIQALDYMTSVYERSIEAKIEVHEKIGELADIIRGISEVQYKTTAPAGIAKRLNPRNFPPCIKIILRGVTSGSRNYAISVLLTSFLSYARIAPGKVRDPKVADYVKDVKILTEEILPMIYEAAERCNPPLLEDQPLEKMNITYHLGLGLSEEIRLERSGSSRWYFPPNCEKIRREAPSLCRPDEACGTIKNPLTYYFVKIRGVREEKPEKGKELPTKKEKEEIETRPKSGEILEGKIVKIHDGSGLIQRCPKCKRWIIDDFCIVHSDVEGIWDLRIKAELIDGNKYENLIFMKEATEKTLGITLEKAKKLGETETLKKISESLIGKRFKIEGKKLGTNFIVKSIKEV